MGDLLLLIGVPAVVAGCAAWVSVASRRASWIAVSILILSAGVAGLVASRGWPTSQGVVTWVLTGAWPIACAFGIARTKQVDRRPLVAAIAGSAGYVAALLLGASMAMELGVLSP